MEHMVLMGAESVRSAASVMSNAVERFGQIVACLGEENLRHENALRNIFNEALQDLERVIAEHR